MHLGSLKRPCFCNLLLPLLFASLSSAGLRNWHHCSMVAESGGRFLKFLGGYVHYEKAVTRGFKTHLDRPQYKRFAASSPFKKASQRSAGLTHVRLERSKSRSYSFSDFEPRRHLKPLPASQSALLFLLPRALLRGKILVSSPIVCPSTCRLLLPSTLHCTIRRRRARRPWCLLRPLRLR